MSRCQPKPSISTASDIRKREVDEAVDRIVGDPSTHACFAEQSDDDSLGFGSGAERRSVSSQIVAIPGGRVSVVCGVEAREVTETLEQRGVDDRDSEHEGGIGDGDIACGHRQTVDDGDIAQVETSMTHHCRR